MFLLSCGFIFFFFFNDTATTEIYTLSLHDALLIFAAGAFELRAIAGACGKKSVITTGRVADQDRKSTRLNSSHTVISYAVFCLKKKKTTRQSNRSKTSDRQNT